MKKKLYLLPGIMTNELLWSYLLPYLKNDYELINISIPLENSFDEVVDVLASRFKNKKINLLGFSLGGYIATYFALKYPSLVSKVFIVGSSPCMLLEEEIEKRKNAINFVKQNGLKDLSRKKVISLLDKKNEKNDNLIKLIQKMYTDLGKDTFITQFTSTLSRNNLFDELKEFKNVMTFYYCKNDRLVNVKYLNKIKKERKDFTFIEIEGFSHMIPLESPKNLSNEIKLWLEST